MSTENDLVKQINNRFQSLSNIMQETEDDIGTLINTVKPSLPNTAPGVSFYNIIQSKTDLHHEDLMNQCEQQLQFITEHQHQLDELEEEIKKTKKQVQNEEQKLDGIKNEIAKYNEKLLKLAKQEQILTAYKTLTRITFSNSNSPAFRGYIERKETSEFEVIFNEEVDESLEHEQAVNKIWEKIENMYT